MDAERLAAVEAEILALKASLAKLREEASSTHIDGVITGAVPPLPGRLRAMRAQRILTNHAGKVTALSWAANSTQLASVCQSGRLQFWDGLAGTAQQVIKLRNSWALTVCLDFRYAP